MQLIASRNFGPIFRSYGCDGKSLTKKLVDDCSTYIIKSKQLHKTKTRINNL